MRSLIAPEFMLQCEKRYFEKSGVKSIDVMERAAQYLADIALKRFPDAERIFIACGPGGNGGDGYACARILKNAGKDVHVLPTAAAKSPDAAENCRRALAAGIPLHGAAEEMPAPELWIDCIYGTGLSRAPEGAAAALIRRMNADACPVLAADIPSGLNGRNGRAYPDCVHAEITAAFQFAKYGHILEDGLDACGEIIVCDVGFPGNAFPDNLPLQIMPEDLRGLFIPRKRNMHKGLCGHLLIVAGSEGMAGAAALCTRAALRSGCGLVSVACPRSIVPIIQTLAPAAMCIPLPEQNGAISADAAEIIRSSLAGKSAAAIGCGFSRKVPVCVIQAVLDSGLPAVIDADALNILSEHPEIALNESHIITPHIGEAARLLGRPVADPVSDAAALSKNGETVVLKSASRMIANGRTVYISASGSCGMARGGSGDVFTGITGALLAERSDRTLVQTAAAACEIHGSCGMFAAEKYGVRAMNSADLIEFLPEVFKRYVD